MRQSVLLAQWLLSLCIVLAAAATFIRVVSGYLEILREQERRKGITADTAPMVQADKRSSQLYRFKRWLFSTCAFIFQNHTRRCLFGGFVMLITFGSLCTLKIVSIILQLHDDDGAEYLQGRTGQLIGYDFWPTMLYCLASMAFLITGHFSSLLWCASAQSFYSRAEGAALARSTKRELWMATVIDSMCYILPGVCCILAHAVDDGFYLKPHPSMSYEMVLAFHFQLKGLASLAMWLTDQRIASRVVANLSAHQATQEQLRINKIEVQNQVAAAATAAASAVRNGPHSLVVRTATDGTSPSALNGKHKLLVDTSLNRQASEEHLLVSPMSSAGVTLGDSSPMEKNRRVSATDTAAPFGVPASTDTGIAVTAVGDRGAHTSVDSVGGGGRHSPVQSKDLGGLEAVPTVSARDVNAVTRLRPKANAVRSMHTDGGAASHTVDESPDEAVVGSGGRAPVNPKSAAYRSTSESPELITAPPKKLFAPAAASENGPPLSVMHARPNSVTMVSDQATTVVELQPFRRPEDSTTSNKPASRVSLDGSGGVGAVGDKSVALFVGFKPRASMGSSPQQMPPRAGPPSPSALQSISGGGAMATPAAATTASSSPATRQSQAEIAAESRRKIADFTAALSKHNRAASFTSSTWFLGNTLFGWIPLLRSFIPFLLPVQVLFSLLGMRTFLSTLTPRSNGAQSTHTTSDPKTKTTTSRKTSSGGARGLAAAFSLPQPATQPDTMDTKLLMDSRVQPDVSQRQPGKTDAIQNV